MAKNALIFGLIAGIIVSLVMVISMLKGVNNMNFDHGMAYGYTSMLVGFAMLYFGVKNYRDKQCNGYISFGKAFTLGLYIALIASTMYVVTWMIDLKFFIPDFMDKYAAAAVAKAQAAHATDAEMAAKIKEMDGYKAMYQNPVMIVLLTYTEILPVGLLVALLSAWKLKKKVVIANV